MGTAVISVRIKRERVAVYAQAGFSRVVLFSRGRGPAPRVRRERGGVDARVTHTRGVTYSR